jgi:hypothetical protein
MVDQDGVRWTQVLALADHLLILDMVGLVMERLS